MPSVMVVPIQGPIGPQGPPGDSTIQLTASINLSGQRCVTQLPDGTVTYADSSTLADVSAPLWVTLGAALTGNLVTVQAIGIVTEPSWSWTPGPVYLGLVGVLTQTVPAYPSSAFLVQLGYATSATSIVLDQQPSIVLS